MYIYIFISFPHVSYDFFELIYSTSYTSVNRRPSHSRVKRTEMRKVFTAQYAMHSTISPSYFSFVPVLMFRKSTGNNKRDEPR